MGKKQLTTCSYFLLIANNVFPNFYIIICNFETYNLFFIFLIHFFPLLFFMSKTDTSVPITWIIYQTAGGKYLKWLETQFSSSDVSSITCVCVLWATLQEQPRHIHFNEGGSQLRCFCCAKVFVEVFHKCSLQCSYSFTAQYKCTYLSFPILWSLLK